MQIRDLNKQIALFVTEKVGTMTCAYFFALLALISLPEALSSEDPLEIVSWIAETFLQLVLLSIIIVGQNIQGDIAEQQAQTDRETLAAIKKLAEEIHVVATQSQQNWSSFHRSILFISAAQWYCLQDQAHAQIDWSVF